MLFYLYVSGCVWAVTVHPVVFQCRLQQLEFPKWHSSVGQFPLCFSSGVPVYSASTRWIDQWYPSIHWVNQWYFSGIAEYTGIANVHWLRIKAVNSAHRGPVTRKMFPFDDVTMRWNPGHVKAFFLPHILKQTLNTWNQFSNYKRMPHSTVSFTLKCNWRHMRK